MAKHGPYTACEIVEGDKEYVQIAKSFVGFYYQKFDTIQGPVLIDNNQVNPACHETLKQLMNLYSDNALQSIESREALGKDAIVVNLASLKFVKIIHAVTTVDCQPMFDGILIVMVTGQLQTDDDHAIPFCHSFTLRKAGEAWLIQHEIFRLCLHNFGSQ